MINKGANTVEDAKYWGNLPKHAIILYLSDEDYKALDNIICAVGASPNVEIGINLIARIILEYGNPTWIFRGPRKDGRPLTEEELKEYRLSDDYKEKMLKKINSATDWREQSHNPDDIW